LNLSAIIQSLLILKKHKLIIQQAMFIFVLLFVGVVQAQNVPSKSLTVDVTFVSMQETQLLLHADQLKYAQSTKDNNMKVD
jgi:hypothetical protein